MSARDDILGAVRDALASDPTGSGARVETADIDRRIEAHARGPVPARTDLDARALVDLFETQARGVDASCARVASMGDVPAAVAAYLQAENLPARLVMAPDTRLDAAPWDIVPLLEIRRGAPQAADEVGVTGAVGGVAETGTLVTASGPSHPATLNFVPETHVVILPAAAVKKTYEDLLDEIRTDGPLPRTINFITGPSRSGDIEQTIQLGAHGPRRLHIILVGAPDG
ncbi:MAG: LUD domain-containing protein [Alphaproteobacteria bacterium]|nr:LUD domain-containing protein [Alphaproteobacteria bacterium]